MKKKVLWLIGTLVIGAVGSGLWEIAFKPVLLFLETAGLNIATLGLDSLRNDLYQDIAKGQYERAGIMLLSINFATIISITIVTIQRAFFFIKRLPELTEYKKKNEPKYVSPYLALNILTLGLVFLIAIITLDVARMTYADRAVNYFEQSLEITTPYLSFQESALVKSRFAQIKTREDYVSVINELKEIASKNNLRLPEFTPY